jgi:hypothetical protein
VLLWESLEKVQDIPGSNGEALFSVKLQPYVNKLSDFTL